MERLGNFITAKRWWIVLFWVVAAVAIIGLSPTIASVENADQSSFLPDKYESVQAQKLAEKVAPQSADATDIIVFKSTSGRPLNASEQQTATHIIAALGKAGLHDVLSVEPSRSQSPTHAVMLAQVTYNGNGQSTSLTDAVKAVRSRLKDQTAATTLSAKVTGEVAINADTEASFNKALQIVSIGTIVLVFVLPMIVFRSPFIGLLPVLSVGLVYSIAGGLIADAAKIFDFKVSQQLSVLFTVVLFGVGTDYILFLLFRYREKLRTGDHTRQAAAFALSRAGSAIMSAALVVIASFVAMFFAQFGIFSSFAPGLVICVAVMMLAALTLIPALVAIIGPKLFWPSKNWMAKPEKPTLSKKIGGFVARHPARAAGVTLVILLALAAGALSYTADFSSVGKAPANTESGDAYSQIEAAFPAGVLSPTVVYVSSQERLTPAQLAPLTQKLSAAQGVANVLPPTMLPDGKNAIYTVILKDNPFTNTALSNVAGPIRDAAHSVHIDNARILVSGVSGALADVKAATDHDLRVVFPVAAVFIFVILALLLRSLVAPLYLLISVSLGFTATLGATVWLFTKLGNEPGLIFFLPIMLYLFVVAIGTDYNILTITRLREEVREGNKPHEAADLTIEHSSGTVVSAGIILAGTFASLMLARISLLTQMGASIAIGVGLAAFVVAPILIPSVSTMLGYSIWWPGHKPSTKAKRDDRTAPLSTE